MNRVAQYLQEHITGEITTATDALTYFSTDASIFKIVPQIVVYPRNENDVRKVARFAWQLAERGRKVPLTARGAGSDLTGAALGKGVVMVFPSHMSNLVTLDSRKGLVTVQPGIKFGKLQQALYTHGAFLPPYPASAEYSTIGGAIANNAGGEKSVKYGVMKDYVKSLRVVLANGEVITTGPLSKREISKKMGLATFEGEIYRGVDALLGDYAHVIHGSRLPVTKNAAGYNIWDIKTKDGTLDLTPLFVGSQGTLGIVTEASLTTRPHNPAKRLVVAAFDDFDNANEAIMKLRELVPSAMELVDEKLLNYVDKQHPNLLKNLIEKPFAKLMLLVEFDDSKKYTQKKRAKKAKKILEKYSVGVKIAEEAHEQEELWKMRNSTVAMLSQASDRSKPLPVVEDGIVPPEKLADFIFGIYKLFEGLGIDIAIWGHAGDANLHVQPFFDISQVGDRQKIFRLLDAYTKMIASMGGSITAQHNDGRLRGPYLKQLYGDEIYEVFTRVKAIFDPHDTLNPGVKINVNAQDVQSNVRDQYSLDHFYDYMPRT